MTATLVMDVLSQPESEPSFWLEKMGGLMFGIIIIAKIKLLFHTKFLMLL